MARHSARVVMIASLLLASASAARALTLLSDDRSVMKRTEINMGPPPIEVVETPDPAFSPFHVDLGGASQDSEIDLVTVPGPGDTLTATASGAAFGIVLFNDTIRSNSIFSIPFRVDAPAATVDLAGELNLTSSFASASVTLRAGATVLFEQAAESDPILGSPKPFQFTALLAAGDYAITARADGSGGLGNPGSGIFSLAMTVSENVPEPRPALLIALGSMGLAGLRRYGRHP